MPLSVVYWRCIALLALALAELTAAIAVWAVHLANDPAPPPVYRNPTMKRTLNTPPHTRETCPGWTDDGGNW